MARNEDEKSQDPNFVANPGRRRFLRRAGFTMLLGGGVAMTGSIGIALVKYRAETDQVLDEAERRFPSPGTEKLNESQRYIQSVEESLAQEKPVSIDQTKLTEALKTNGQQLLHNQVYQERMSENNTLLYGIGEMAPGMLVAGAGISLYVKNMENKASTPIIQASPQPQNP